MLGGRSLLLNPLHAVAICAIKRGVMPRFRGALSRVWAAADDDAAMKTGHLHPHGVLYNTGLHVHPHPPPPAGDVNDLGRAGHRFDGYEQFI